MVQDTKENQSFGIHGALTAILRKGDGTVIVTKKDNLIVDAGFDLICDSLGDGTRPALISHIAVGTGAVAAAAGDVGLGVEAARLAATYAHTGGTKVFTMSITFPAGTGTAALTEAGILNAATVGTLLDRVVFPVINKGASDSLDITFTFTLS